MMNANTLFVVGLVCYVGWLCFMFGRIYEKDKLSDQFNAMKDEAARYRALYEMMGGKP